MAKRQVAVGNVYPLALVWFIESEALEASAGKRCGAMRQKSYTDTDRRVCRGTQMAATMNVKLELYRDGKFMCCAMNDRYTEWASCLQNKIPNCWVMLREIKIH